MKNSLVVCLVIAVVMIITPLMGLKSNVQSADSPPATEKIKSETSAESAEGSDTISVFRHLTGKTEELPLFEYAIGVVAGEMPAVYGEQALMAQAAASLNIARRELANGVKTELGGAVISDDSSVHQCCLTEEEMHVRWGDKYDEYYKKIEAAVEAVYDYKIMYGSALASTVFHAVSPGKTESAKNVWGNDVVYLKPVNSSWDAEKPDFTSELTLSAEAFSDMLCASFGITPQGDASKWIGECKYSDSGTLLNAIICSKNITGGELRSCLSLKSAAIKIAYGEAGFIFTVSGYGHGVGMSQYGASKMAEKGSTWQEIIAHYYPGTIIV